MIKLHLTDKVLGVAIGGLVGYEVWAIKNKVPGDTYSERTREYFAIKGKTGSFIFLSFLGTSSAWFAAHIVKRPYAANI